MNNGYDSLNRKFAALNIKHVNGRAQLEHLICVRLDNETKSSAAAWCQKRFVDEWIWSSPPRQGTLISSFNQHRMHSSLNWHLLIVYLRDLIMLPRDTQNFHNPIHDHICVLAYSPILLDLD